MQKMKRQISTLILFTFILFSIMNVFATNSDYEKHWAKNYLDKGFDMGLIQGFGPNILKPENPLTRAQFAQIFLNIFNFNETANNTFSDVKTSAWYAKAVMAAKKAGIINGYDNGLFSPEKAITRQEAITMIGRAFEYKPADNMAYKKFHDYTLIKEWASSYISALTELNILVGKGDGKLHPDDKITRAEGVKIICSIVDGLVNAKSPTMNGLSGKTINGTLVVNTPGAVIENLTIEKDLYLAPGIGEGDVTIKNVKVNGKTIVKGGGENSILVENCIFDQVDINKGNGKIRLVIKGTTTIDTISTYSGLDLQQDSLQQGKGIKNLNVLNMEKGQKLDISCDIELLIITNPESSINLNAGNIKNIETKETAANSLINLVGSTIESALINANIKINLNSGKVNMLKLSGKAQNSEVNINGAEIAEVEVNVKAKIKVQKGTLKTLDITGKATDSEVEISQSAKISKLQTDSKIEIIGLGIIEAAIFTIADIISEIVPERVAVFGNIEIKIKGFIFNESNSDKNLKKDEDPFPLPSPSSSTSPSTTPSPSSSTSQQPQNSTSPSVNPLLTGVSALIDDVGYSGLISNSNRTATLNLEDLNDSALITKIIISASNGNTITTSSIVAPNIATINAVKTLSDISNITISQLLGEGNNNISLGTLRRNCGNKLTIHGTLSDSGNSSASSNVKLELILSADNAFGFVPQEYIEVTTMGRTVTAAIKSGKENTLIADLGIRNTILAYFGELPSYVGTSPSQLYLVSTQKANIASAIETLSGKSWDTIKLDDLVNKTIYFKKSGSNELYTLNIILDNMYFYIISEGTTITAKIKPGKETTTMAQIGSVSTLFSELCDGNNPEQIKVNDSFIDITLNNYSTIQNQIVTLCGGSSWSSLTLSNLVDKTIYLKKAPTTYTIKFTN